MTRKKEHKPYITYMTIAGTILLAGCQSHQHGIGKGTGPVVFSSQTCKTIRKPDHTSSNNKAAAIPSPKVIIYKTRKDYSHLVPVLMDETRTRILSYPAPSDLQHNGNPTLPTPLVRGFWLDNRGIGPTVAFLSYTYEEYIEFPTAPSLEEMMKHIIDKYPLTDFKICGRRVDYENIVTELNEKIRKEGWK